jgi:hypothetical protein
MRPRKSRIFYEGKYFDYPLKAFNALRTWAPSRPSSAWQLRDGRGAPAEGPDQLRGLARRPLRLAALPHVLQDLHREGVGRAGQLDARRLGRAAGQEPLARQRHHQRLLPKRNQKDIASLIEEFQYPKYGPGMMWERLPRQGRGRRAAEGAHGDQGRRPSSATPTAGATAVTAGTRTAPTTEPRRPRHQLDADLAPAALAMDPPVPDRGEGRAKRPAVPRLPHRRPRHARGRWSTLRRQLDLHPLARREGGPHPELRLLVAVHGEGRAHTASGSSTSCSRATTCGTPRRRAHRAGKKELEHLGLANPVRSRRLRRPDAQGLPDLRRALPRQRRRPARLARRAHPERVARGPQRHAQVQQPGPLDVHGHAHRREHRRRRRPRHLGSERRRGVPRGEPTRKRSSGRRRTTRPAVPASPVASTSQ